MIWAGGPVAERPAEVAFIPHGNDMDAASPLRGIASVVKLRGDDWVGGPPISRLPTDAWSGKG